MENQTIREQIFDALFDYTEKWGSICTEADCATVRDEICLRIDQCQFMADEAEEHINQEVEKRIAERMPSEEDVRNELCRHLYNWLENNAFKDGCNWLRSRLTTQVTPQDTHQVQKEGGGE